MQITPRIGQRRGRAAAAAIFSFALIAGACSNKKDEDGGDTKTTQSEASAAPQETQASTPTASSAPGETTPATEGSTAETPAPTEPPPPAEKPVPGGKITISGEAEVANPWTPAAMQCDSYCQMRARTFFEPLVTVGTDLTWHPVLAESVTPNADYSQWTIKLRSGIKFHDGTDLTADVAIDNLQRTGSGFLIRAALRDVARDETCFKAAADQTAKFACPFKLTKTDDLTFVMWLGAEGDASKPFSWPLAPLGLAGQLGFMASSKWLAAADKDKTLESKPVGTGPFMFASYEPRKSLVVKKNPNYWQKDADGVQLPYLDEVEFRVIEDSEIAESALRNGEIDAFSTSSGLVIQNFRDTPDDFPMIEQEKLGETGYALIHLTSPNKALADRRVRCALSMAVDRQAVIDAAGGGINKVANGLFSPGQEGYLEDNGFNPAQDIEGAKALIDEYEAETGTQVKVRYGKTVSATNDTIAELYSDYWKQIGVETQIDTVPQDSFITNALLGIPEFEIYGWRNHGGFTIDSQYIWWHSKVAVPDGAGLSLNFPRLADPVIDAALDKARNTPDAAARKAAAEDVNRQMAKECYAIPVSWTIWGTPHAPKVQGFGQFALPDGTLAADGAGFPGQFFTHTLWVKQ